MYLMNTKRDSIFNNLSITVFKVSQSWLKHVDYYCIYVLRVCQSVIDARSAIVKFLLMAAQQWSVLTLQRGNMVDRMDR